MTDDEAYYQAMHGLDPTALRDEARSDSYETQLIRCADELQAIRRVLAAIYQVLERRR